MIDKPIVTTDIETTLSCFLMGIKHWQDPTVHVYEISWRKNQINEALKHLNYLQQIDAFMLGYNISEFDYPIIHELMTNPASFHPGKSYEMAQKIIEKQKIPGMSRSNAIALAKRLIHYIDLVKIWHFDNESKRTRLKDLEFAMRSPNVADLPHDFRSHLTSEQIDDYIEYMKVDICETEKFGGFTAERIKLRRDLLQTRSLFGDVMNWNDTKLGEMFFINKLGRDLCYNGREPKGTDRLTVEFKDVILPQVQFRRESFQEIRETFETKRWVKGDKDHNETISFKRHLGGLEFAFGSGGVHASVKNRAFRSSETHKIIDIDVSGMYPAVGIANRFYPEHLGEKFVDVYRQLKTDRKQYKKGTAMNSVLKLAQNGVYGKSNSEYSPMFDIKYLFKITVNGQLQLTMLAEMLLSIPGLELIQCNTDGISAYVPRAYEWMFDVWKAEWEKQTGLELEQVEYKAMFVRDVNNYLAVKTDGKVKRIGAYWFAESWEDYDAGPGKWHTDVSMQVVPKVAEQVMLHGYNAEFILRTMTDPYDFMIRQKIKGSQKGFIGTTETQKTLRYYVSKAGAPLTTVRPPSGPLGQYKRKNSLQEKFFNQVMQEIGPGVWDARIHVGNAKKPESQKKYEDQVSAIQKGWLVKDCCVASDFNWADVDYDFYLEEINKLIIRES